MALEYGYVITIEKDGTAYPETTPTNQWQKRDQGGEWSDIAGEKGLTYVVDDEDRSCDIRLSQDFGGVKVRSNFLTVTSTSPGCPYKDIISELKISPTSAAEGDIISIDTNYEVSGLSDSERTTTWFGTPETGGVVMLQAGGDTLVVSVIHVIQCKDIYVEQKYNAINAANPDCNLKVFSNKVEVLDVPSTSFGNTTLSGPNKVRVGDVETWTMSYDGDLIHYAADLKYPTGIAELVSENRLVGSYEVTLKFTSVGSGNVEVVLTGQDQRVTGENPVSRTKSIESEAVPYTLGTVLLTGPNAVEVNKPYSYTISWTGNAPEEDVSFVYIRDGNGQISDPYSLTTNVTWSSPATNGFLWAQVSYESDTQMPQIDPIVVTTASSSWAFKGTLLSNGVLSLGYYKPGNFFIASGSGGAGKKSTNKGQSWSNFSHAVDAPLSTFPISNTQTVWAGYGGGRSDDNVYWDNNGSKSWSPGFPNGSFVYGAAKLKDGSFIATDISGFVWETNTFGGTFSKTSIQLDSYSVMLQGNLANDGGVFGIGAGKVWKIMGLSGSNLNFVSATLPFGSAPGSVVCPIAEHNGLYVCGGDGAHIFWSTNFTSWTKSSSPSSLLPSGARVTGVVYAGNKWWATAGYTGTLYLLSSEDGKGWVREDLPVGISGYNNPKMIGYGDTAIWTMDASSSPYTTYYCVMGS